jgi:branched-chain amino acid transport system substrate-binding protein
MKKIILSGIALGFAAALSATTALADITIGLAGPITGDLAAYGEQLKRGAELAVADINAAGGIKGEKIVLEIGDDRCDPKEGTAVAEQLSQKGIKFVVGHFCSGATIPASKVYEEEGVLMMTPSATNPKLTDEGGWNVTRVCGRDDAQGQVAGAYLAKHYAGKKVAILDDKSAYGKGLADETRKAMNAAGLTETMNESYNAGEDDYNALVSKMKEAGIEAVYFGGYHAEIGKILKQMAEQGMKAQGISGDANNTLELGTIAGKASDGFIFTFAPEPRNFPTAAEVVKKFKDGGYDPEGYTLFTYAAFQMYAAAVKATDSTDPKALAEWLRSGKNTVSTVLGDITLDTKGDVTNPKYVFYKFMDGKYAEDLSIQ